MESWNSLFSKRGLFVYLGYAGTELRLGICKYALWLRGQARSSLGMDFGDKRLTNSDLVSKIICLFDPWLKRISH